MEKRLKILNWQRGFTWKKKKKKPPLGKYSKDTDYSEKPNVQCT